MRGLALLFLIPGITAGQQARGIQVRGEYQNRAGYAYRVKVPDGLVGYRAPAPAPAHGFVLDLGSNAERRIAVDGKYNAEFHSGAREALATTMAWINHKASAAEEPLFRDVALGGLPAVELVAHYRDKKTTEARICRSVAAIRRNKPTDTMGIVYTITLDTTAEDAAKDTVTYDAIVKSFRLNPLLDLDPMAR